MGEEQVNVINADNDMTTNSIGARSGALTSCFDSDLHDGGLAIDMGGEVVGPQRKAVRRSGRLRDGRLANGDVLKYDPLVTTSRTLT